MIGEVKILPLDDLNIIENNKKDLIRLIIIQK